MRVTHVFAPKVVTDPVEALRRAVFDRHALEACAQAIGVSHQTLSKYFNADEEAQISLLRAAAIEQFLGTDALAECFAARRGGVFLKLPAAKAGAQSPSMVRFAALVKEFGEAVKAFGEAEDDQRVEPAEVDRFEKELRDVYTAGAQVVAALRLEQGEGPAK